MSDRTTAIIALTALATILALGAPLAAADDTEVFFVRPATDDSRSANVLFMFDTSGSMGDHDGTPYRRITRLKQAMLDVFDDTEGVNIGVGAFNGFRLGGAILYPASDLDADACPGSACDEIVVRTSVREVDDDAEETPGGRVDLTSTELHLMQGHPAPTPSGVIGLRFAELDVPRGAIIRHASLELTSREKNGKGTALEISAQKAADAPGFAAVDGDLKSRARTTAKVDWDVAPWNDADAQQRSPDLRSIVQEIVSDGGWCGGNALALLVEGTGSRVAYSRDSGPWNAPVLRIAYDPRTVDYDDTCLSRTTRARIVDPDDDAAQSLPPGEGGSGEVELAAASLTVRDDASDYLVGLRFDGLDLPAGAQIASARLRMKSAADHAGTDTAAITVRGEAAAFSRPFVAGDGDDIRARAPTGTSVPWNRVEGRTAGDRVESPDIGDVVADIVDTAGWHSGDPVTLVLSHAGGDARRTFASAEGGAGAVLEVTYRRDGDDLGGEKVVLRTARDEMRDRVHEFRPDGGTPLIDAYLEAAAYMTGDDVWFGKRRGEQKKRDRPFRLSHPGTYTGGNVYTPPDCSDVDPSSIACVKEEIEGSPVYEGPVSGACQANQIVLLSDGAATENSSRELIEFATGANECARQANKNTECGIELASWLQGLHGDGTANDPGQVLTHTVGFNLSNDAGATDFLKSLANEGHGNFYPADSASQLSSVFRTIVTEAADINTGFTPGTAPIDRFERTSNHEDVYYAMFRPDASARWDGNLKRYKLGIDAATTEATVLDRQDLSIFDETDGGIVPTARSFWGTGADGADVSRGGAANGYPSPRTVKTFLYDAETGVPGELIDLAETEAAIDLATLDITTRDAAYRTKLLRWARGQDVLDVDGDGDRDEVRMQMGDPMHSPPFVLDYQGDGDTRSSLVFVGTNEGYLHAIDTASGAEKFAIVPPDLLPNLQRFLDDETGTDRPYGLDGEIMGWVEDTDGNLAVDGAEKAYVVVGMRRGGRNYYAFDVSDPDAPELAWTIRGGAGDFEKLGQSWSAPVRTKLNVSGTVTDVLIFAGGYDPTNDARDERVDDGATAGRAIYVVDASDGTRIAALDVSSFSDMKYDVPADANVIDIDFDGLADLLFVGDMGGQLWRFDFDDTGSPTPTDTIDGIGVTGGVIADFNGGGKGGKGGKGGNRRFYHTPDVALLREGGESFLTIAIGSGWRAHPLDTVVDDRFYVLRDPAVYGSPRDTDGNVAYPKHADGSLYDASNATAASDAGGKSRTGWYISLAREGEKVLGSSLTLNGQVLFTSYIPDTENVDECSVSVGTGRLYALDVLTAEATLDLNETENGFADRWRALLTPGIPAPVSVLTEGTSGESLVLTSDGKEDDVDFGDVIRRTYWAEE